MGVQLIFVVETNKKCNSDWIYIKDTIGQFYEYERTKIKFSVVYMDGKGNYNSNKKEKEIKKYISLYSAASKTNRSRVIYCFDCDDYDVKAEDRKFLEEVVKYCYDRTYDLIWFCKDVEQVYLGKKVDDIQKKKEAELFKMKKLITKIHRDNLLGMKYQKNTSNIMSVLDSFPELTRKK